MQRAGYRGYIGSRPYRGHRVPQHVQNLVVRTYCQRNKVQYLLSATEYAMPNCYIMLNEVMSELDHIEGAVLYSLFMLPDDRERREAFWNRALAANASVHGAVEDWAVRTPADVKRAEDLWVVTSAMNHAANPVAFIG